MQSVNWYGGAYQQTIHNRWNGEKDPGTKGLDDNWLKNNQNNDSLIGEVENHGKKLNKSVKLIKWDEKARV